MPCYYEFFAGGGMARAGLGAGWQCLFANDIDRKKAASYATNWGTRELVVADVASLKTTDIPGVADLAWASFPCQDLSLAGSGAGLSGDRSGTFWLFWQLVRRLGREDRSPTLIVLENVCGALASHGGKDFAAISAAIARENYRFGAVVVDAVHFLPQSRPRLFIICAKQGVRIPEGIMALHADDLWHPPHLTNAYGKLSRAAKASWVWWRLPLPRPRHTTFSDIIETEPKGVEWHQPAETRYLLSLMSPINRKKVEAARKLGRLVVGGIYKRTRVDERGRRAQRAEVRFDDVAGCLRTPVGGSSRQTILLVNGRDIRSRLLSPREAARLMGLPDNYRLPENYNEAYHLAGDGVAVPVVRHLAKNVLEPLVFSGEAHEKDAEWAACVSS